MVAAGRTIRLGYFDHPPAVWWLAWLAQHLAGSQAPIVVRLPFILLFALATWLMYRLGAELFSARAGLFAAITYNLSPLFGVVFGTFVLPDGPLDAALIAAALFLARALATPTGGAPDEEVLRWWLAAGLAAGLALASKYNAILVLLGAFLYLATSARDRFWLARREPWLGIVIAFLVFLPTLIWNGRHDWTSFAFQGDRAFGLAFHPLAPLIVFGGEALYLLPWIWLPLVLSGVSAARRGPGEWRGWLLFCLALPAVLFFSVIALWAQGRVLFHWAAPGYLMLFPLLGRAIEARLAGGARGVRIWLIGTACFVVIATTLVATEVRLNWPIDLAARFPAGHDPALQLQDWHFLRSALARRHLLDRPGLVIGTVRWSDAAKIGYALGPTRPVVVLGSEPHQFGLEHPLARYRGHDVLILAPDVGSRRMAASFGDLFDRIETLAPLTLLEAGRVVLIIPLYLGHGLR